MKRGEVTFQSIGEEDLSILYRWFNNPFTYGKFDECSPVSKRRLQEKLRRGCFDAQVRETKIILFERSPVGFLNFAQDPVDSWIVQLGVVIAEEKMRNRGIGTAAHKLAVYYIFQRYSTVHKIEGVTDEKHIAERRVLDKAGFTFEGVLRWRNRRKEKFFNMAYYGILRTELTPSYYAGRK